MSVEFVLFRDLSGIKLKYLLNRGISKDVLIKWVDVTLRQYLYPRFEKNFLLISISSENMISNKTSLWR